MTSSLRKCWRFAIGRGLNLASGLLLAEAELQSFEYFAMQRMCNSRVPKGLSIRMNVVIKIGKYVSLRDVYDE